MIHYLIIFVQFRQNFSSVHPRVKPASYCNEFSLINKFRCQICCLAVGRVKKILLAKRPACEYNIDQQNLKQWFISVYYQAFFA
jgi:hypothetical protein